MLVPSVPTRRAAWRLPSRAAVTLFLAFPLALPACTPLYPANGPRPFADARPAAGVERCRRLSDKFATSGGVTKVSGPLAAAGGVTAAILGGTDHQGASAGAGAFAMLMAVTAAVSGILHEGYTLDYLNECTIKAGGDPARGENDKSAAEKNGP